MEAQRNNMVNSRLSHVSTTRNLRGNVKSPSSSDNATGNRQIDDETIEKVGRAIEAGKGPAKLYLALVIECLSTGRSSVTASKDFRNRKGIERTSFWRHAGMLQERGLVSLDSGKGRSAEVILL